MRRWVEWVFLAGWCAFVAWYGSSHVLRLGDWVALVGTSYLFGWWDGNKAALRRLAHLAGRRRAAS